MLKEKYKNIELSKPVKNQDGSVDFPVVFTRMLDKNSKVVSDRDGDIINPHGVHGLETAVVSYRHNQCGGMPVDTGAEIVNETLSFSEKEVSGHIRVHPSDEAYFCDLNSIKKNSNGKILDQVEKGHIKSVSLGFRYNTADVETRYIDGKKYYYYKNIHVMEVSLLDTIPSNLSSYITYKTINMEKTKCLDCLIKNGIDKFAVNKMGVVVKVKSLDEGAELGVDFEGNEVSLDDTFEPIIYPEGEEETKEAETAPTTEEDKKGESKEKENTKEAADKACSCMNPKKPTLKNPLNNGEKEIGDRVTESVSNDVAAETAMNQTILDNQAMLIEMITELKSKIDSMGSNIQSETVKAIEGIKEEFSQKMAQKTVNSIEETEKPFTYSNIISHLV